MDPPPQIDEAAHDYTTNQSNNYESGLSSSYTTSASSMTAWGPGALTGKILYGFGAWVLRGIEKAIIQQRLAKAIPRFPHLDVAAPKGVRRIYEDVLELSRPGIGYNPRVRRRALRLVLMQIGTRNTYYLIQTLKYWPLVEMRHFISEIMACLPADWVEVQRDKMHRELSEAYLSPQAHLDQPEHPAISFIIFVCQLTQVNSQAGQAVLDGGFLDMLLRLYYWHITPQYFMRDHEGKSPLLFACDSALVILSARPASRQIIFQHPLCILWPKNHPSLFTRVSAPSVDDPLKRRKLMWKRLETRLVGHRLDDILDAIMDWTTFQEMTVDLVDACGDLVEFLRADTYGTATAECALARLFTCIALGHELWRVLNFVLAHSTYEDILNVFSTIVRRFLPLTMSPKKFDSTPVLMVHDFVMSWSESIHLLDCFVGFTITAAEHSDFIRRALLDAGISNLLLPLLSYKYGHLEKMTIRPVSTPLATRKADISKLLNSIRVHGLGDLPVEPADDHSRKLMCQQAIEILSGRDRTEINKYIT